MLIVLEETLAIQPYQFVSLFRWLAEVSESAVKSAVSCFCYTLLVAIKANIKIYLLQCNCAHITN